MVQLEKLYQVHCQFSIQFRVELKAGVGVFGSKENKNYTLLQLWMVEIYQFDITSGDNPSLEFMEEQHIHLIIQTHQMALVEHIHLDLLINKSRFKYNCIY